MTTNPQTEARASLRIDEKWSVEYNPSNNNRPGRVLRYGEPVTGGSTDWKNDTFAMFYALLERDAALAAKDAELSDLQILLVSARQRAERAEAQPAEANKALEDKDRIDTLRELCGYVEDGSHTRVIIMQDDVTKEWLIRVGDKWPSHGSSLRAAIDVPRAARRARETQGGREEHG